MASDKFAAADAAWSPIPIRPPGRSIEIYRRKHFSIHGGRYSRIYLNIGIDEMTREVIKMIDKYSADGLSCIPTEAANHTPSSLDIQRIVRESAPASLMIEADMVDERSFPKARSNTNRCVHGSSQGKEECGK